ncbi:transcription activator of gluconeogenesis ERT1 [Acrasis kona]|uniref:Transcription activator of gluconeogenesis ERT1 n=1 Tax=Acrasis kona TaxID=1008807 RepID=A0AAW2ZNF1_9EUKA
MIATHNTHYTYQEDPTRKIHRKAARYTNVQFSQSRTPVQTVFASPHPVNSIIVTPFVQHNERRIITTHACKECRLHHKSCNGERPCLRCRDKGLCCESVPRKRTTRKSSTQNVVKPTLNTPISEEDRLYQTMYDMLQKSFLNLHSAKIKKPERCRSIINKVAVQVSEPTVTM